MGVLARGLAFFFFWSLGFGFWFCQGRIPLCSHPWPLHIHGHPVLVFSSLYHLEPFLPLSLILFSPSFLHLSIISLLCYILLSLPTFVFSLLKQTNKNPHAFLAHYLVQHMTSAIFSLSCIPGPLLIQHLTSGTDLHLCVLCSSSKLHIPKWMNVS